jgi:hypothetical protein
MQELTLSENLAQIELEINHHKQIAGQSIWEIGRRLNHVKENDLVHGQFMAWLEKVEIDHTSAKRMMKIATELPNSATLHHLGTTALHLIATLPEAERAQQLERIEQGDNPTVRELQEVKRQLNLAKSENEDLREKNERLAEQALKGMETKTIEKEVVKEVEVTPVDYDSTKSLNQTLMAKNQELSKENQALEEELEELKAKGKISQEMEELISQRQGKIQGLKKRRARVVECLGGKASRAYQDRKFAQAVFKEAELDFKGYFNVPNYAMLPKKHELAAMTYWDNWQPSNNTKLGIEARNGQMVMDLIS